jgi:hypothetical protein
MTRVKRARYLRIAAVAAAAAVVLASAVPADASKGPNVTKPSAAGQEAPAPADHQFIYTDQADLPGPVKRVETWASVDGTRNGSIRWTKCSMEGHTIPQCLIRLPKGHGPDQLNDRTYQGIQQKLPRDPALLAAYLQRQNSCDADPARPMLAPNQAAFSEIILITSGIQVLPPGYGKLLFQAAAKIPGTNVLAHVADAAGGSGTAVAMVESTAKIESAGRNWGRFELIFTPGTYQYIGLQSFRGPSARGPWKLSGATSLRSYKFVNTAPRNYTGNASFGSSGALCFSP